MNTMEIVRAAHTYATQNKVALAKKDPLRDVIITNLDEVGRIFEVREGTSLDNLAEACEYFSKGSAADIDEIGKVLAEVLDESIMLYRQHVNPAIAALKQAISENIDALDETSPQKNILDSIHLVDIPAPIADFPEHFNLSSYNNMSFSPRKSFKQALFPSMDERDRITGVYTGQKDIDTAISEWMSSFDPTELEPCAKFFEERLHYSEFLDWIRSYTPLEAINLTTYMWLMADRMMSNPTSETTMGIGEFKEAATMIKDTCGILLNRAISRTLTNAIKRKQLVIARKDESISVVSTIMAEYTKGGGSMISLAGNLLNNGTTTTLEGLLNTVVEDTRRYNRHVALQQNMSSTRKLNAIKPIAINTFSNTFPKTTDELAEVELGNATWGIDKYRTNCIERAKAVVNNASRADIMNLDVLALKIICNTRFAETDAETMLLSMEQIAIDNPDFDIDDIRLVAVIRNIGRYLSTLITIEDVY